MDKNELFKMLSKHFINDIKELNIINEIFLENNSDISSEIIRSKIKRLNEDKLNITVPKKEEKESYYYNWVQQKNVFHNHISNKKEIDKARKQRNDIAGKINLLEDILTITENVELQINDIILNKEDYLARHEIERKKYPKIIYTNVMEEYFWHIRQDCKSINEAAEKTCLYFYKDAENISPDSFIRLKIQDNKRKKIKAK